MVEMKVTKPFIGMFTTFVFIFSTMFTIAYFWFDATGQRVGVSGLSLSDKNPSMLGVVFDVLNWILDVVSWISPFALILDLLFLRPVSWITSMITVEWAISKIPTESAA
jgi:hypothetical protein